jgi:hypothetical protein
VVVLAAIVGAAVLGGGAASPGPDADGQDVSSPSVTPPVAYVPRPSPWAVPSPTVDPATFEGAGALAATEFVIPSPRWLAGPRAVAARGLVTVPIGGLRSRTNAYAK